jgi:hypothetical protein
LWRIRAEGSGGGQRVDGEIAAGEACNLRRQVPEQNVPPLVVLRAVRAVAAGLCQGRHEVAVVELETQDGGE